MVQALGSLRVKIVQTLDSLRAKIVQILGSLRVIIVQTLGSLRIKLSRLLVHWATVTTGLLKHRRRNRWGRSSHGLTTFLTCYYKAKSRVRRAMSLPHSLLAYTIARDHNRYFLSVYCRASSEMSDTVVAVRLNCSSAQHSKVTHSLHKHLAWTL